MAPRRGDAIRVWFAAVLVTMLVAGAAWSAPGLSAAGRFVPDEIVVKFRTPAPDANSLPEDKVRHLEGLHLSGEGFRVREVRPVLKGFDHQRDALRSLRGLEPARLTQEQRHLLQRQRRTTAAGRSRNLGNIYRIRVDLGAGANLNQVLAAYRSRPDVEYAEPNPIISICGTPNDRLYADQWALAKIHASEAWDMCRGSDDIVVAVIDTGVDYNHPDLRGNLWTNDAETQGQPGVDDDKNGYVDDIRGYNFLAGDNDPIDDHGHGTVCAGIIAAVGNNGTDIAGVCWTARIMPLKILDSTGNGTAADAVPAIYYAVHNGADIISGSWGGTDVSDALRDAVAYAYDEGVVVVAAAGNSSSDTPYYPAGYPEVISVAATDASDHRWYLSNYGDWVDIAAPGQNIISLRATRPGETPQIGTSTRMSGTSVAAPHVAGTCALLLAADPLLTSDELHRILTTTGDSIDPGTCSSNCRLNVYAALQAVIPVEGTIRMDRGSYTQGADISLLLADWRWKGAGRCTASVETSGGDLEVVTLRETSVAPGVFRGILASENAEGKVGDGILQVRDGESIQARYLYNADISGQADAWRVASAVADYNAPRLVNLEIKPEGGATAIEFQTNEPTRAEIRYGKSNSGPYDQVQRGPGLVAQHRILLPGLMVPSRHYFVVALTDAAGNEAVLDNGGQSYSLLALLPGP